jgi:hypothetical protein
MSSDLLGGYPYREVVHPDPLELEGWAREESGGETWWTHPDHGEATFSRAEAMFEAGLE